MRQKSYYFFKKWKEYIWLLGIIVTAVCLQLFVLGNKIQNGIELSNTLDFSWQTDSIERFLHGFIAGRDFIFTYGPLFQFIYSLPAIFFHQSSYISVLYAPILLTIFNVLFLFLIFKLIAKNIKTATILTAFLFIIIDLISYDPNALFRILLPFLYGVLISNFFSINKTPSLRIIILLFLPTFFGMYTFDLFIFCTLILTLFICYEFFILYKNEGNKQQLNKYILRGFLYLFLVGLLAMLTSILLSGNFNYLIYSFDTVKNYQFVMSIPWSVNKYFFLMVFPIGSCFLLVYILKKIDLNYNLKINLIFLTLIAILQLKSAFIRSDDGHIIMGIYPSILVLFILFYFILRRGITAFFIIFFLCFYFLIPIKSNYQNVISFQNLISTLSPLQTNKSFFFLYRLPQNYYYTQQDFRIFESLISKNPGNVMIYPYDSYILNIHNETYNTVALQFYQYSNSIVEKKSVEKLRTSPPRYIILGLDDKGAIRLDNIPNFSRNSLFSKWMFENYIIEKRFNNFLILHFNPNKKQRKTNKSCSAYDIDTKEFMEDNIFESLFKSSTYYLENDTGIRLPYMPNTQKLFIVERFNEYATLERIFDRSNLYKNKIREKKRMKIIKKSPIPIIQKIYEEDFFVTCY